MTNSRAMPNTRVGHELHAQRKAEYEEHGYIIIDNVLDAEQVAQVRTELQPFLNSNILGRNNFEGVLSNRVYALAAKSPAIANLIQHPLALGFVEAELGQSCLLSACLAINLQPGESVQPWHYDTGHLHIPRPREAYGVSVFWALDDTTEENGATEIIPGSHHWGDEQPDGAIADEDFAQQILQRENSLHQANDVHKATMPVGSLMFAKGTLWHRGGANNSDKPRLILTPQYGPGWARQLENMAIAISPKKVAALPKRVQELIGYSIHPPFMGYTDGVHPARVLSDL